MKPTMPGTPTGSSSGSTEMVKVSVDIPNHWAAGSESLWALPLGDNRYQLENVPFYAYDLNFGDIVEAVPASPADQPRVLRVIERGGHQTIRVIFDTDVLAETCVEYVQSLASLDVTYERAGTHYFALDLEPHTAIDAVIEHLESWAVEGVAEYETCEARVPGSFGDAPPNSP